MAKGDDIQERLINFGVSIIKLCAELPDTPAGRHVAGQLLRCGTSPAPNYGEARGAESTKDFIHKLGVVFKELKESNVWLEMIKRSGLLPAEAVNPVQTECIELCKIIASSIRTAGKTRK
ncbi:MAG: four helix bundle protein [Calditrichaceae bacterium]|nr:four helix bundle protein [Calditrichia bacterium]NUQ43816.1 four helix bundle protein [Calditrichaceae bacterium]